MRVTSWLDGYQRRHRWAGFPVAVVYKFFDDQGRYLAALITYYGVPLALPAAAPAGVCARLRARRATRTCRQRILDSALSQFPVIGDQLSDPHGLQGSGAAVVVGGLVALYGALGVAQALQNAMNVAWSVPRNRRPNPREGSSAQLAAHRDRRHRRPCHDDPVGARRQRRGRRRPFSLDAVALLVTFAAVVVNAAVFMRRVPPLDRHQAAASATSRPVPSPPPSSGSCCRCSGRRTSASVVKDAGITYGVFAVVLGLLAWLFLAALGVVLSVEINVVRSKHLFPRALLTPFTDNVDLTRADQRAYTDAATAQRHKGFESVEVTFEHEGQQASARKRADDEARTNGSEIVRDENI